MDLLTGFNCSHTCSHVRQQSLTRIHTSVIIIASGHPRLRAIKRLRVLLFPSGPRKINNRTCQIVVQESSNLPDIIRGRPCLRVKGACRPKGYIIVPLQLSRCTVTTDENAIEALVVPCLNMRRFIVQNSRLVPAVTRRRGSAISPSGGGRRWGFHNSRGGGRGRGFNRGGGGRRGRRRGG